MIKAESVKTQLRNQAIENNRIFQDALIIYGLERTLYRLSISKHMEKFALKGGIFLYGFFDGSFSRATSDIDLMALMTNNQLSNIESIFIDVFSIQVDDALIYDLSTLEVSVITEFKEYHGVNVSVISYLDKSRIPISIDIGFNDVIFPERILMEFPVLLDMDKPKIYAYSYQSVVAEKFETIVSLGFVNSRLKDFYDIYILSISCNFNGEVLKSALIKTFDHRRTKFEDIVAFNDVFANDSQRKKRWNAFVVKKRTMLNLELDDVINGIRNFLEPVVFAINLNNRFNKEWDHIVQKWLD